MANDLKDHFQLLRRTYAHIRFRISRDDLLLEHRLLIRRQFHQHFMRRFFEQKCFAQLFCAYHGTVWVFVIFWQKEIGAKTVCKLLERRLLIRLPSQQQEIYPPTISQSFAVFLQAAICGVIFRTLVKIVVE